MAEDGLVTEEKVLECAREYASTLGEGSIILIKSTRNPGAFLVYHAEKDRGIVFGNHFFKRSSSDPGPVLSEEEILRKNGYTTTGHNRDNEFGIESFIFMRPAIVRLREMRELGGAA